MRRRSRNRLSLSVESPWPTIGERRSLFDSGRRVGKGFARDLEARALSGAAQLAPGAALPEGGAEPRASQESKRK
jgi:hypothetical protein